MVRTARIRELMAGPLDGPAIEAMSMAYIEEQVEKEQFDELEWPIVCRVVHAVGDVSVASCLRFSPGAIQAGIGALREGCSIYVDTEMIRAGLSKSRLEAASPGFDSSRIYCYVRDPQVVEEARRLRLPRAICAVRKARSLLDNAIVVIGNSPTALLEINRLCIEEGLKPALIIGVPVGFVFVEESKAELMSLDVPYITMLGARGGSAAAVSIVHALCGLAAGQNASREQKRPRIAFDAVVLLGHGSRLSTAADAMYRVGQSLQHRLGIPVIPCNMSLRKPFLEDAIAKCKRHCASRILVLPYFLNNGVHIRVDIPRKLKELAESCPELQIVLGPSLGYDPVLVELVERRVNESLHLPDIRQIELTGEDDI